MSFLKVWIKNSQLDIALTIGHQAPSFYEQTELLRDEKHFNLEHLYRLAKALDVDVREFLKPLSELA